MEDDRTVVIDGSGDHRQIDHSLLFVHRVVRSFLRPAELEFHSSPNVSGSAVVLPASFFRYPLNDGVSAESSLDIPLHSPNELPGNARPKKKHGASQGRGERTDHEDQHADRQCKTARLYPQEN